MEGGRITWKKFLYFGPRVVDNKGMRSIIRTAALTAAFALALGACSSAQEGYQAGLHPEAPTTLAIPRCPEDAIHYPDADGDCLPFDDMTADQLTQVCIEAYADPASDSPYWEETPNLEGEAILAGCEGLAEAAYEGYDEEDLLAMTCASLLGIHWDAEGGATERLIPFSNCMMGN